MNAFLEKAVTPPRLVKKLLFAFVLIILLMGASYIFITAYFANKYNQATAQRVNANVAKHLIQEKFQYASPFLDDGSVNKTLFGDVMHDMMAVNRSIEVYLLDQQGEILYSVVLDHDTNSPVKQVSLAPIHTFIASEGKQYVLGDDPRNPGQQKIFSAAAFSTAGHKGFVYIILAGKEFQLISNDLLAPYFAKLGVGATLLTMLFAVIIGMLSVWFLTKNLRLISRVIKRFQEGDLSARIKNPEKSDIEVFALSFNAMADDIVNNIDRMKSVDLLRRELIANVSHDLRTPLAILKGYVETLQIKKDTLTEVEREEYLQITHDNVDRLSKLINQLFEYSKLEAEQVQPNKEPFSICELSNDLIAKFNLMSEERNIELVLEMPEENCLVVADVSLIERALQNLIENALKFTDAGGKVSLVVKEERNGNVEIMVKDTGIGIPEAEQPFIFDRYKQVEGTSPKSGYGLGLAIVKKIMKLHNTSITLVSKFKKGSSFVFRLPSYKLP